MSESIESQVKKLIDDFANVKWDRYGRGVVEEGLSTAYSLALLGKDAVPTLIAALDHKKPFGVAVVATALGEIGDERAIQPLLAHFEKQSDSTAISQIASALNKFPVEAVLPTMKQALQLKNPRKVAHAVDWFSKKCVPGTVDLLIPLLKHKNKDVQTEVTFALGQCGDPKAVDPLLDLLKSGKNNVRLATALGRLKDKRAVDPLISLLNDPDQVDDIVEALGDIGDSRAIPAIEAIPVEPDDRWLREKINTALKKLRKE